MDSFGQVKAAKVDPVEGIQNSTINRDIGLCLTVGFAFMLLLDQFADAASHSTHQPVPISVNDFRGGSGSAGGGVGIGANGNQLLDPKNTPTLGFIIHAAADGELIVYIVTIHLPGIVQWHLYRKYSDTTKSI